MLTERDALPEQLCGMREAAELLAVSTQTVRRLMNAGELLPVRIGRRLLFRTADVAALIERHTKAETTAA